MKILTFWRKKMGEINTTDKVVNTRLLVYEHEKEKYIEMCYWISMNECQMLNLFVCECLHTCVCIEHNVFQSPVIHSCTIQW